MTTEQFPYESVRQALDELVEGLRREDFTDSDFVIAMERFRMRFREALRPRREGDWDELVLLLMCAIPLANNPNLSSDYPAAVATVRDWLVGERGPRPQEDDVLLAAIDRVYDALTTVPLAEYRHFPQDPPRAFRAAAVDVLREITRLRFAADGGDLERLDAMGVDDPNSILASADLSDMIAGFGADGDSVRYSTLRAIEAWIQASSAGPR
jgi:hypothetical protein